MNKMKIMNKMKMRLRLRRRDIKFFFQRLFRGWDDSNLWSLDYALFKWILPQLKLFKAKVEDGSIIGIPTITHEYMTWVFSNQESTPGDEIIEFNESEWIRIIGEMIYALEWITENGWPHAPIDDEYMRVMKGYGYFVKYLPALWD